MRAAAHTSGLSDTAFHWTCAFHWRKNVLVSGMRQPVPEVDEVRERRTGVACEPLASGWADVFDEPRSTVPYRNGADDVGQCWRGGACDRGRCVLAVFDISTSLSFFGAAGCDPGSWQRPASGDCHEIGERDRDVTERS